MMRFRRGDVVLVRFPNSDLRTYKHRPAVVVQSDSLPNGGLEQTVIAMITSKSGRAAYPCRVAVDLHTAAGRRSGLLKDSVIMADNVATVLNTELDRKIGEWPAMLAVDAALRVTFGL